jgi:transketolase
MNFDQKKIKLYSTVGPRASLGLFMLDFVKENPDLILLTSDVSTSAGLDRFRKNFPENYIDVGIAEQNLISVASGLSSEGFKTVTTTFAPFQTMRCCEQIKVNSSYMKIKNCMIGIASGLVLGNLGYTHCCIEDLSIIRSLPNITVISPSDSLETIKAVEAAINHNTATYIRVTGTSNNPIIHEKDYNFQLGKNILMNNGDDVCIFATGVILREAIDAAKILKENDISAKVINVHTIKPINAKEIKNELKNIKLAFSVEEHSIVGGLGSAISEVLTEGGINTRLMRLGINDKYDKGGDYEFLKEKNELTARKIAKIIKENFLKN